MNTETCLLCAAPATIELHEAGFPVILFCSRACLKRFALDNFRVLAVQERLL